MLMGNRNATQRSPQIQALVLAGVSQQPTKTRSKHRYSMGRLTSSSSQEPQTRLLCTDKTCPAHT